METRGKNRAGAKTPTGDWSRANKTRFTSVLWHKWLAEFNTEPAQELVEGIKTFRALCHEPVARASKAFHSAPTQEIAET